MRNLATDQDLAIKAAGAFSVLLAALFYFKLRAENNLAAGLCGLELLALWIFVALGKRSAPAFWSMTPFFAVMAAGTALLAVGNLIQIVMDVKGGNPSDIGPNLPIPLFGLLFCFGAIRSRRRSATA